MLSTALCFGLGHYYANVISSTDSSISNKQIVSSYSLILSNACMSLVMECCMGLYTCFESFHLREDAWNRDSNKGIPSVGKDCMRIVFPHSDPLP